MAEAPKRRPGRPRKNPLEKPEQFSIRLPLQRKIELEVLARVKNESLSQAVVRAIEVASRVIEVPDEDNSVERVVSVGMSATAGYFRNKDGYPYTFDAISHMIAKNPDAYRALVIPDSLRRPEEKLFYFIINAIASDANNDEVIIKMAEKGELETLLRACLAASIYGITPETFPRDDEPLSSEKIMDWVKQIFKPR